MFFLYLPFMILWFVVIIDQYHVLSTFNIPVSSLANIPLFVLFTYDIIHKN